MCSPESLGERLGSERGMGVLVGRDQSTQQEAVFQEQQEPRACVVEKGKEAREGKRGPGSGVFFSLFQTTRESLFRNSQRQKQGPLGLRRETGKGKEPGEEEGEGKGLLGRELVGVIS